MSVGNNNIMAAACQTPYAGPASAVEVWGKKIHTFLGSDTIDLVDVVPQTRASRNRRVHRHGARRCIYIPAGPYVLGMCGIESSYFAITGFPR